MYGEIEGLLSRLEALVQTLGNNQVAAILGVNPAAVSRWRSRKESPRSEHQNSILALDHVASRLFGWFMPRTALDWLRSFNDVLNTRPIDALTLGRFDDVLSAIDIEEQGGHW